MLPAWTWRRRCSRSVGSPTADATQGVLTRPAEQGLQLGEAVRLTRGRYALPGLDEHRAAAASLGGALDRLSAARQWDWKVKFLPGRPQVVVPRGRNVSAARRMGIDVRWGEVSADELAAGRHVEGAHRPGVCPAPALRRRRSRCVDSALRAGQSRTSLLLACARLPRTGQSRAYRVIELGSPLAANPFESVMRAVLEDVPGTDFRPQVLGRQCRTCRPGRPGARIAVECDSFEFHADAEALNHDMERYNAFVCEGYLVLRFGWKHAMFSRTTSVPRCWTPCRRARDDQLADARPDRAA